MMRLLEGLVFVSLAGAVHLGVWVTAPNVAGSQSGGTSGQNTLTVSAAMPAFEALVERWDTAPDAVTALPTVNPPILPTAVSRPAHTEVKDAPVRPLQSPSMPGMDVPRLPQIDSSPTAATDASKSNQTVSQLRPKARPPQPQAAPQRAQRAAGQGAQTAQGRAAQAPVASKTAGQTAALMALWGAQINAKIQNHVVYPKGTSAQGTAKLSLSIRPDGKLAGLSLHRSTGNPVLDRAALRAAKHAGRFAKAPQGLEKAQYVFAISLTFARD